MATKIQPSFQAAWPPQLDPAAKSYLGKLACQIQLIARVIFYPFIAIYNHLSNLACRIIMPGCVDLPYISDSWWEIAKLITRFIWNPDNFKADLTNNGEYFLSTEGGKRVQIKTPDGVAIEGAFFRNYATDKVVIVSGGNGTQWEVQGRWLKVLQPLGVSVMLLNPRGVGNSHGHRSTSGWALDFYSAAEYLFQKEGFAPGNCLPMGFSMGGSTATRGAELIQNRYPSVAIPALNICSFSTLQSQVSAMFMAPIAVCANAILSGLNVTLDPTSSMKKLKGKRVVMYRPDDKLITYPGSMAAAFEGTPNVQVVKLDAGAEHNDPFSDKEVDFIQYEVRRLLNLRQPWLSQTTAGKYV